MNVERLVAALEARTDTMADAVVALAEINSGSFHPEGVERTAQCLADLAGELDPDAIDLMPVGPTPVMESDGTLAERPVGPALVARKRSDAPVQVLLFGHLDTVFGVDHPFQRVERLGTRLHGPGVADCKGGLVIALEALRAVESSDLGERLGWELLVVPDEEVGSVGSKSLLADAAGRHDAGLGFEPALTSGAVAGARKGSLNFHVVAKGRAAHVGRHHADGISALRAIANVVERTEQANEQLDGVTVSCGRISGGGPLNVVPDFGLASFNARVASPDAQRALEEYLDAVLGAETAAALSATWTSRRPPKQLDERARSLVEQLAAGSTALGLDIAVEDTGGACDGNDLAAAGLANLDSLGARGSGIHSADEHADIGSFAERCALTVFMLDAIAHDTTRSRPASDTEVTR